MSEEQKRNNEVKSSNAPPAAAMPSSTNSTALGQAKRDANATECTNQNAVSNKKQKKSTDVFSITGLKYAEAKATPGGKVTLLREPENTYDANAVKVVNCYGQLIGRIEKSMAAVLSPKMKKLEEEYHKQQLKLLVEGTIQNAGDGWQQLVEVEFKKIPTKTVASTAKPRAKSAVATKLVPNPYAKSASTGGSK